METTSKPGTNPAADGTITPCPIVVCTDNNYAQYVLPLFQSIVCNTRLDLAFFVIYSKLTEENRDRIARIVRQGNSSHTIEFIEFDFFTWCRKTPFKPEDFRPFRNTKDCYDNYSRLFLSQLFFRERGIRYLLYLDVDIVVNRCIDPLFTETARIDLMGAVQDGDKLKNQEKGGKYINSGVLLLDLKAIDEFDFTHKALAYDQANRDHMKYFDQDIINGIIPPDRLYMLDDIYNFQDNNPRRLKDAVILHYTGTKPWNKNYMWRKKKCIWYTYHLASRLALHGFVPGRATFLLINTAVTIVRPLLNIAKGIRKHLLPGA